MILDDLNYYSRAKKNGLNVEPVFERLITRVDVTFLATNPNEEELSSYDANRVTSSDTMAIKHPSIEIANKKWKESLDSYHLNGDNLGQSKIIH